MSGTLQGTYRASMNQNLKSTALHSDEVYSLWGSNEEDVHEAQEEL